MEEYVQSVPGLTETSQCFYDLIKGRNLLVYHDAQIRSAVSQAVAIEGPRGWHLGKRLQSHKVDVVIALQHGLPGVRARPRQSVRR